MELGCNLLSSELHPNSIGPQTDDDDVVRVNGKTELVSPQQKTLTPTSQKPIEIGQNVRVSVGVNDTDDWLDNVIVRAKEIPPKAWIDVIETHGRLYARWKSKIPAPTTGKKSLYVAPLAPIRTENKLDDKARESLKNKRRRSANKHNRNAGSGSN